MKKTILTLIILLESILVNSQINDYLPQVVSPSPQASMFDKYINHKVNTYSGIPEITIPLGEITVENLTIPIVLSYHASGIKYLSYDGEVGAGWSLSVGNYRVSRTINGKCDFEVPTRYSMDKHISLEEYDKELYVWGMHYFQNSRGNDRSFEETIDYKVDPEYDIFTFNTPTRNGKFLLLENSYDAASCEHLGTPIGESNNELIKIDAVRSEIMDDLGNTFVFGMDTKTGTDITEKYRDLSTWDLNRFQTVGWPLTFAYNSLGQGARFFYKEYTQIKSRQIYETQFIRHHALTEGRGTNSFPSLNIHGIHESRYSRFKPSSEPLFEYSYKVYSLDRIEGPNIDIFINRIDARKDGNSPSLIRSIEFKDKKGKSLKTVDFKYNFDASPLSEMKLYLHYILESITIDYPNSHPEEYKLDYYESSFRRTKGQGPDLWGYYISPGLDLPPGFNIGKVDVFLDRRNTKDVYLDRYDIPSYRKLIYSEFTDIGAGTGELDFLNFSDRSSNNNPHIFSLKKITYPTKGYTEYEYEPNEIYDQSTLKLKKAGGMRVKRIKSVSGDQTPDFISAYTYTGGIPSFNVDHTSLMKSMLHYSTLNPINEHFITFGRTDTYSTAILDYLPVSDFSVNYSEVKISNLIYKNGITENNGSIVYEYAIPDRYRVSHLREIRAKYTPPGYLYGTNRKVISKYKTGYSPTVKSKKTLSKNNELLEEEQYSYSDFLPKNKLNTSSLVALKIERGITFSGRVGDAAPNSRERFRKKALLTWNQHYAGDGGLPNDVVSEYCYLETYFRTLDYRIDLGGKELLVKKKHITYNKNTNPIISTENYDYDTLGRLTKTTIIGSENKEMTEENFYPTETYNPVLYKRNIKSVITKSQSKINGKLVKEVEKIYPTEVIDDPSGINYDITSLPSKILTRTSDEKASPVTEIDIKYQLQTAKLEQYIAKNNLPVIYLWSYNSSYPIAEIKNANYDDVKNAVKAVFGTDIPGVSWLPSVTLNQLKNLQTNTLLRDAMVSLYTYKPHVGMETSTDPSGKTTYYNLDNSGKLIDVKNNEGKIISEYSYVYRDRQESNIGINILQENLPHIGVNKLTITSNQTEGAYLWLIRDSSGNAVAWGNTPNITYSFIPGEYYIDYSLTDPIGNIVSDTKKIEVENLSARWGNQATPDFAGLVKFSGYGSGGSGKYQYNWSIKNKQGSVIKTFTGSSSIEYNVSEGEFTVDCTVTDLITNEKASLLPHKINVKPAYLELKHNWLMASDKGTTNGMVKFMIDVSGGGGYPYYSFSWRIRGEGIAYDFEVNDIEVYAQLPSKSGDYVIECTVKDALYNHEQTFTYKIQVVGEIIQFSDVVNTTQKASARVKIASVTNLEFFLGYSGDKIPVGSYVNYKIWHSNGTIFMNEQITSNGLAKGRVFNNIPKGTLYVEMVVDPQKYKEIYSSIHLRLLNPNSEKIIGSPTGLYYPIKP